MPLIKRTKEIEEDNEEDEELVKEDEEIEFRPSGYPKETRGRPKGTFKKPIPIIEKEETKARQTRFTSFRNPERVGIVDVETNEILAEGDFLIPQALANIIERLERIENSIGSMMSS